MDVGKNKVSRLEESDFEKHPSIRNIKQSNSFPDFSFRLLEVSEVQNQLKKLNIKKAIGWDTISPRLFRMTADGITQSLTSLYNNCIKLGQWPEEWKMEEWVPVFKKDDRSDKNNYRPITISIVIEYVFELLLAKQITEYYEAELYDNMTAYRRSHSCEYTLLRQTEDWKRAINYNEYVAVLSADMT